MRIELTRPTGVESNHPALNSVGWICHRAAVVPIGQEQEALSGDALNWGLQLAAFVLAVLCWHTPHQQINGRGTILLEGGKGTAAASLAHALLRNDRSGWLGRVFDRCSGWQRVLRVQRPSNAAGRSHGFRVWGINRVKALIFVRSESPHTTILADELRRLEAALRAAWADRTNGVSDAADDCLQSPASSPVEVVDPSIRKSEMDSLIRVAESAQRTFERIEVQIIAEAGMGKTHTAKRFVEHIGKHGDGCIILSLKGSPEDKNEQWSSLRRFWNNANNRALWQKITNAESSLTAQHIDRLFGIGGEAAAPAQLSSQQARDFHLAAFARELADVAKNRLLIFWIEDGHWVDPATRIWIARMAQHPGRLRMMILKTLRPLPMATAIEAPLSSLGNCRIIRLEPLLTMESERLAMKWLKGIRLEPSELEAMLATAGGNPLYLRQICELKMDTATTSRLRYQPSGLREMMQHRLSALATPQATCLQMASLVGEHFLEEILPSDARSHLPSLIGRGWIIPTENHAQGDASAWQFVHARLAEIIRETLPEERIRDGSAQLADAWERSSAIHGIADEHSAALARMWEQAAQPERAAQHWLKAGQRAACLWEPDEAMRCFNRCLECADQHQPELRWEARFQKLALQSWTQAHDLQEIDRLIAELAASQTESVSDDLRFRIDHLRMVALVRLQRIGEILPAVAQARSRYAPMPHSRESYMLDYIEAIGQFHAGKLEQASALLSPIATGGEAARLTNEATRARLLLGNCANASMQPQLAEREWQTARAMARHYNDRVTEAVALNNLAHLAQNQGRWVDTMTTLQDSLEVAELIGDHHATMRASGNLGHALWRMGRLTAAEAMQSRSAAIADSANDACGKSLCASNLGLIRFTQARLPEASKLLNHALSSASDRNDIGHIAFCERLLAEIAAAEGNFCPAKAYFHSAQSRFLHLKDCVRAKECQLATLAIESISIPSDVIPSLEDLLAMDLPELFLLRLPPPHRADIGAAFLRHLEAQLARLSDPNEIESFRHGLPWRAALLQA